MQHLVDGDIDDQIGSRSDEHDQRLLHKGLVDNSVGRLIHHVEDEYPHNVYVGQCPQELHPVVTECHF